MPRPGGAQPLPVAGSAVKSGAKADDRHSCGSGRSHARRRVFEDEHPGGLRAELAGGVEIDVRTGLAARDMLGGAEQSVAEMMGEAEPLQGVAQPAGRAGGSDGLGDRGKLGEEVRYSGHRRYLVHPPLERCLGPRPEIGGERAPDLRLDDGDGVAPVEADIAVDRLFQGSGMAELRQRFGEDEVREDLAVGDDPVEIEDERFELQRRSPNNAVPTRTCVAPVATAVR